MQDVFKNAFSSLSAKHDGFTEDKIAACDRIDRFMGVVSGKCAKLKADFTSKKDFNAVFAEEVLIPLAGGTCIPVINKKAGRHHKDLKSAEDFGMDGLVMGKKILPL